ncbi:MAG: hypothetical protein JWN83_1519, partial [Chitinophagaceae bacterium]|nr:hypothetical protein [Chitinophagaceae bacterium]
YVKVNQISSAFKIGSLINKGFILLISGKNNASSQKIDGRKFPGSLINQH